MLKEALRFIFGGPIADIADDVEDRDINEPLIDINMTESSNCVSSNVLQDWLCNLPFMQQSVLLTAIRGPDGIEKYSPIKYLLRWFRRCIVISAMDGCVLTDPFDERGVSFTGPSIILDPKDNSGKPWIVKDFRTEEDGWLAMDRLVDAYIQMLDCVPHHFQMHFMHAAQILGYKHPDEFIRNWWNYVYIRLVHDMHLNVETEEEMDMRLGDNREQWLARCDKAVTS